MTQRSFYVGWLLLGVLQLASFTLSGCSDATGQVLSQEPIEASARALQDSGSAVNANLPVRISRTLFDHPVTGKISFVIPDQSMNETSAISWTETPQPTAPALAEGDPSENQLLAQFQDSIGCAEFRTESGLELCFKMEGDVSSLTLSADQVSLYGVKAITDVSCISEARFLGATKAGNSRFTVSYELVQTSQPRCQHQGGVLSLTVQSSSTS